MALLVATIPLTMMLSDAVSDIQIIVMYLSLLAAAISLMPSALVLFLQGTPNPNADAAKQPPGQQEKLEGTAYSPKCICL